MAGMSAVALYTLRELTRRKLLYFLVGGGAVLTLGIGVLFAIARSAAPSGVLPSQDLSGFVLYQMSSIVSFFAWISAIAISLTLISYDIDSGSAVSIFSKPVTRLQYAVGKVLAAVAALLLIIVVLGIGTQVVVLINGGGHEGSLLKTFALIAANQATQMLAIMVLSVLMNNIVAAILGILFIQAGKIVDTAHFFIDQASQAGASGSGFETVGNVVTGLYWILPRYLDSDLVQDILRESQGVSGAAAASASVHVSDLVDVAYWAAYAVVLFGILYWLLRRKEV